MLLSGHIMECSVQEKTSIDVYKRQAKDNPALLPIQIAYYTGLRIGEVCALTWQDINLDEQDVYKRQAYRCSSCKKILIDYANR